MTSVKPPHDHVLNQTVEPWSDQTRWSQSRTNWTIACALRVGMFSERMKGRGSRSTQTCKPCTWWRYKLGMSVEVCSHNYSVKPRRSNVSKPNHWSRLTGVKPQLSECISCCFCRLVKIRPMSCKGMLEVAWSGHRIGAHACRSEAFEHMFIYDHSRWWKVIWSFIITITIFFFAF